MARRAAISYSKHRDAHGLAGVEVRGTEAGQATAYVAFARSWPRKQLSRVAPDVLAYWSRIKWDMTAIDQLAGQHLIQELRGLGVPVEPFAAQKDVKGDERSRQVKQVEDLVVMDKVEQVQFTIWLRQQDDPPGLRWPSNPSKSMKALEEQMAQYSEHKTEAGSVDYYAPGEERDEMVKALLAALFSVRILLEHGRGGQGEYGSIDLGGSAAAARAVLSGEGSLYALLQASDRRRRGDDLAAFADEFAYSVGAPAV